MIYRFGVLRQDMINHREQHEVDFESRSSMESTENTENNAGIELIRQEIARSTSSSGKRLFDKFLMAALGSIPWVGGFVSALASLKAEQGDIHADDMRTRWLSEHQTKITSLEKTLGEIHERFEKLGDQIDERVRSEEYLSLVRRAFRVWDHADTKEKRTYVANIVANASGTRLCSDDVVRLFIDWLNSYHESHFAVIREIYQNPGATRYDIWSNIYGDIPREDSAEADLYRLLIRDLSTGGVIRQDRDVTVDGRFLRKRAPRHRGPISSTMESAFEDTKQYVLTELGKQFVHYTMNDIVPRIGAGQTAESA